MSKQRIKERLEEASISAAVEEMLIEQGQNIRSELACMDDSDKVKPDSSHRLNFDKALERAYRRGRLRTFLNSLRKPVKYTAAVLASVTVIFSVSIVSVDAFRIRFINWVTNLNDNYIHVDFNGESSQQNNPVSPEGTLIYLPPRFMFESIQDENNIKVVTYKSEDSFVQLTVYPINTSMNIDTENIDRGQSVEINGCDGMLIAKKGFTRITWSNEKSIYTLYTNDSALTDDELITAAESAD